MAIKPVPPLTDVPPFPALSDRASDTYNSKAFAFGTHLSVKFNGELAAIAQNVIHNATEAAAEAAASAASARASAESAGVALGAVELMQDAATYAETALASKQAAALSEGAAAQSAANALQAKQSVDQSLAAVAGGPVVSINGLTGIVKIKVPTTGDVVVSARGDYSAPVYLPCDGGLYFRVSYPELAAMLPIQYPSTRIADPGTLPPGEGRCIAISSSGHMAVGCDTSPYLRLYRRASSVQFLLVNLTTNPPGIVTSVDFSSDGTYLAVGHSASPYISIYKRSGDVFTKLTNPASLPGGPPTSVSFAPNGNYLAVGSGQASGRLALYSRSSDTFTRLADPAVMPGSNVDAVAFSPNGLYLAITDLSINGIVLYSRSGNTFTKLADPNMPPTGQPFCLAFSADSGYLAVGGASSSLAIYKRNGDIFSRSATPSVPSGMTVVYNAAFSPNGSFLAVSGLSTNMAIYRRNGDAFIRAQSPSDGFPGIGYGVAFGSDSLTMAFAHTSSPYMTAYRVEYDTNTYFKLPTQTVDGIGLIGYIKT